MTSERVQRQIDRFLDEAEEAMGVSDWARVRDRSENALRLDPENADAMAFLAAADRDGGIGEAQAQPAPAQAPPPVPAPQPTSFVNGRYEVRRFPGEGGKKQSTSPMTVRLLQKSRP